MTGCFGPVACREQLLRMVNRPFLAAYPYNYGLACHCLQTYSAQN